MATNIPPHNLTEVCTALVKLLDNPDLTQRAAVPLRQGPRLPDRRRDAELARGAEGDLQDRLRRDPPARAPGRWARRRAASKTIYITSVPYTVNKSTLVERIADVALSRKLPPLARRQDLSTDDVRIALELKKDADEKMVMAYLFKHTPLQTNFPVNLTCLVPTENPEVGRPERLDLHADALPLPALPARGRHQAARARARGAARSASTSSKASRRSSTRSTRSSRSSASPRARPTPRRQIMQALRARRRADRRDPRAEDLPPGPARDPGHPQGARREAQARARRSAALLKSEESRWAIVRDGDRGRSRRSTATRAGRRISSDDGEVGIHRRGLHRRGRQRRDRLARRLGQAAEGSEGPRDHAAARRRRGAGRAAGQHARDRRVLQQLRRRLHRAHRRRAGVDRLRRADPAASSSSRTASGSSRALSLDPRVARRDRREEGGRRAAGARRGGHERRLQPALLARAVRRAEHARRPALRARRRRAPKSSAWRGSTGGEILIAATRAGARDAVPRPTRSTSSPGPGRGVILIKLEPKDDRVLGFIASTGDRDLLTRRDEPRRRADDQHREVRGHRPRRQGPRAAAARPVHARHLAGARRAAAAVGIVATGRKTGSPGSSGSSGSPGSGSPGSGFSGFTGIRSA